jgi:hypothetical protein
MDFETAKQTGLYYAFGREDASGKATVPSASDTETPAYYAFSEAYATAWLDVNQGTRRYAPDVRHAYETWQKSGGQTVRDSVHEALDSAPVSPISLD